MAKNGHVFVNYVVNIKKKAKKALKLRVDFSNP